MVETTEKRLVDTGVRTADDARVQPRPLVQYSPERKTLNLELRKYLYKNLYYNPEVHEPNLRAVQMLGDLFRYFLKHHAEIGEQARKRARKEGWHRAVCDYSRGDDRPLRHRDASAACSVQSARVRQNESLDYRCCS